MVGPKPNGALGAAFAVVGRGIGDPHHKMQTSQGETIVFRSIKPIIEFRLNHDKGSIIMNYKDNLCSAPVPVYPVEELSVEEALAVMAYDEAFCRFATAGLGSEAEDAGPDVKARSEFG
jgi:hypothetical protein